MTDTPDRYADSFDPRQYLHQYYSLPALAADDAALFRTLAAWLRRTGRVFPTALDLGCGPTLHNSFALAPFAHRIDLADYLPANLAEIRAWLAGCPEAHDWDPLLHGVLACEGTPPDQLPARKALYASRVGDLLPCDLRRELPLGRPAAYNLVTSFFCPECVAPDLHAWRAIMARVLALVRPGGSIFFAAMRDCRRYAVLGSWFPATPLTEPDFLDLLPRHGFPPRTVAVHAVPAPDWADDGFDHILLVHATKEPSS